MYLPKGKKSQLDITHFFGFFDADNRIASMCDLAHSSFCAPFLPSTCLQVDQNSGGRLEGGPLRPSPLFLTRLNELQLFLVDTVLVDSILSCWRLINFEDYTLTS